MNNKSALLIACLLGLFLSVTNVFAVRSAEGENSHFQENGADSQNLTATEIVEKALKESGGHLSREQIKELIVSLPPLNAKEQQRVQSIYERMRTSDISSSCSSCFNSCLIENNGGACCNNVACPGGYCDESGTCIGTGSSKSSWIGFVCGLSCI